MVSFADNIGFVFTQTQVNKPIQATIKPVDVVASSKVDVVSNDKVIIMRHKEKSGNYSFVKETVIPDSFDMEALKKAKIVSSIPKGRYEILFIRKAKLEAWNYIVKGMGYKMQLVADVVKEVTA